MDVGIQTPEYAIRDRGGFCEQAFFRHLSKQDKLLVHNHPDVATLRTLALVM